MARELIRRGLSIAAERSVDVVKRWLEDAFKGNLDATVALRIDRFAVDGLLKRLEAAKQRTILDRIDRLESFANAALFLANEMKKTFPRSVDGLGA